MSDMPQWFAWLVLVSGVSIFAISMLYVREVLRYRKTVRAFDWPKPDDKVSMAAHLIEDMDEAQLQELATRTGIRLHGGRSA